MARYSWVTAALVILLGPCGSMTASPFQTEQEPQQQEEEQAEQEENQEEEEEKDFALLGGWLNRSDPVRGMRYSGHQLERLQPMPEEMGNDPQAVFEEETIRIDSETTKTVTRTYHDDGFGSRRLVRVAEETRTVKEDGQEEAVRSISTPDANGRLQLQTEETQRVVSKGDNEFEVATVLSMPGPTRRMRAVEQFVQRETRNSDGTLELDRIYYAMDGNRKWQPVERRTALTRTSGGESTTQEEVYRADLNHRMSLSDQITSRERTTEDGTTSRTTEIRNVNSRGRLELAERVSTVQSTGPEGGVRIVQNVEVLNQGTGRMQPSERIVSSFTPGAESGGSTEIRVETPDGNGRLTLAETYREDRSGAEGSERQTRTLKHQ